MHFHFTVSKFIELPSIVSLNRERIMNSGMRVSASDKKRFFPRLSVHTPPFPQMKTRLVMFVDKTTGLRYSTRNKFIKL